MDFAPTHATDGRAHARVQQPQIIIDFRLCRDGRARIAGRILLANRDCRRDAADFIHVRLIHPLKKLPRVSRQRFDIAPLALCIHRIEGERRFARTADTRHHGHLIYGDRERDVLEVIDASATDFDRFLSHC